MAVPNFQEDSCHNFQFQKFTVWPKTRRRHLQAAQQVLLPYERSLCLINAVKMSPA